MMKPALAVALVLAALATAPAAAQPSQAQRAAATELLVAMRVPELLDNSVRASMEAQLRVTPELRGMEEVMREFARRYVSWEALREQYVELYATTFTEDELRSMTDFYRSDVGQKLARTTPRLLAEGAALGERAIQQHRGELEQMIRARLRPPAPTAPPPPPPPAAPPRP
jgi:hypothetical protein